MKRVCMLGFKKDGKRTKGRQSCTTICSSERATKRKHRRVHVTAMTTRDCDIGLGKGEVQGTLKQQGGFFHDDTCSRTQAK